LLIVPKKDNEDRSKDIKAKMITGYQKQLLDIEMSDLSEKGM
jgi:hypothetical protein